MINHNDIATIRELLGLSRVQFAEAIGYSGSSNSLSNLIYRMEIGKQGLPIGRGEKIWELFRKTWLKKESSRIKKIMANNKLDKKFYRTLPFFKDKKDYKEMFNWQSPLLPHHLYGDLMDCLSKTSELPLKNLTYDDYILDLTLINRYARIIIDDMPETRRMYVNQLFYTLVDLA